MLTKSSLSIVYIRLDKTRSVLFILDKGKVYLQRYRTRKLFEKDFAQQIKLSENGAGQTPAEIANHLHLQTLPNHHETEDIVSEAEGMYKTRLSRLDETRVQYGFR